MIKVLIKRLSDQKVTHSTTHESQELAEAWFTENKTSFGKQDRWLEPSEFDGETTDQAEDSRVVDNAGVNVTEYFFPANFGVLYVDVSNQVNDTLAIQKTLKDQENGFLVIAKIKAVNERKNFSPETLDALMSNAGLMKIRACLQDGSVPTALYLIKNTDTSSIYSSAEKQEIMLFIEDLGYGL